MYCIRHTRILKYSELYLFSCIQAYSRRVKAYSGILRHLLGIFMLIQTYSEPCVTWNIHNLTTFQTLVKLESEVYLKSRETLTIHIQKLTIVKTLYSGIIESYPGISITLHNAHICANMTYSNSWNVQYYSIIAF